MDHTKLPPQIDPKDLQDPEFAAYFEAHGLRDAEAHQDATLTRCDGFKRQDKAA